MAGKGNPPVFLRQPVIIPPDNMRYLEVPLLWG